MITEIDEIRRKMLNNPWPKFLDSITIEGLRGWSGQEVRFAFPVSVISGENGSGKSTVLKCAAIAYTNPQKGQRPFYGSDFFPETAWETISGVTIGYTIKEVTSKEGTRTRQYSYRKQSRNWSEGTERPKREVIWQDISRTLPLDATVGYARIAKRKATETSVQAVDNDTARFYSAILGRQYENIRLATANVDPKRPVGVVQLNGSQFSQFHQGAGEDATLDLLLALQNAPKSSLILIDEVEASLHPYAQRVLIHYLLWLARQKQLQIILSTHSNHVLEELPDDARIFLSRGSTGIEVLYGVTPNYALNRMDVGHHPDLYLFCEDDRAKILIQELIRDSIDLTRVKLVPVGPSDVVITLGRLVSGSRRHFPMNALSILDGDKNAPQGCIKIPGELAPEKQVFEDILKNTASVEYLSGRLDVAHASLQDTLAKSMTTREHHDWIGIVAQELSQSNDYLWTAMCKTWIKHCLSPSDRQTFVSSVQAKLP